MTRKFTAIIKKDVESGMYIGIIPNIPSAHTMAENLNDLQEKLQEVLELCLDEMDSDEIAMLPEYEGSMQIGIRA